MREVMLFIRFCLEAQREPIRDGLAMLVLTVFIFMVMSLATIGSALVTAWRVGTPG